MGKRPKRKIVLFLVEGKSDREALQYVVPELYEQLDENIEVFFPAMRKDGEEVGGDITTRPHVYPRNITDYIYQLFLKDFFDQEKILPKDITEIIQIVDTDGAYIPDEDVVESANPTGLEKPFYDYHSIRTLNPDGIRRRNAHKQENLDYLSSQETIKVKTKTVPFSVYYFSSNLDHVLHDDPNLDATLKRQKAEMFADQYIGNPDGFIEFIAHISEDATRISAMDYATSWEFIKAGHHSIERQTNLIVLFNKLKLEIGNHEQNAEALALAL